MRDEVVECRRVRDLLPTHGSDMNIIVASQRGYFSLSRQRRQDHFDALHVVRCTVPLFIKGSQGIH
jgi:hypothetical protein